MLDYRSDQRFKFIDTPYISDTLLILRDVTYQKEDRTSHIPPAHIYSIYKHGSIEPIGKVKFSFIDSIDENLQGHAEYTMDTNDCNYVYHICMLLKQVARTYNINKFYLSLPENCYFTIEEQNRLNVTSFISEDNITYYVIPVEQL